MAFSAKRFDFAAAHARLQAIDGPGPYGSALSPEAARRILATRAAAARTPAEADDVGRMDVIFFRFGRQGYAVPTSEVSEAAVVAAVAALPGAPRFYRGLVHARGEAVPLLDIGFLFGLPAEADAAPSHALIAAAAGRMVAIAASAVEGGEQIAEADIAAVAGPTPHAALRGYVAGDRILFSAAQLLADARLVVDEEPLAPAQEETQA